MSSPSEAGGKKRKFFTSPTEQPKLSKFFKQSSKSPKETPAVKADDDVKIVDENAGKENVAREKAKKAIAANPEKLAQFERGNVSAKKKVKGEKGEKVKSESKTKEAKKDEASEPAEVVVPTAAMGVLFSEIKNLKRKVTFTPLEQQVITIKKKHMDTLLFVECGYRYRFFAEDAEIVAKELDLNPNMDKNFLSASIPVHRLTVHISRLVEKGYKVGVVNQTETAALKAAGDNKSAPFTRKLSHVYTKATFVDREENADSSSDVSTGRYIISISENKPGSGLPYISLYCVNPTSGDIACINLDSDENIITKIETVFCSLHPSEVLLPKEASDGKIQEYVKGYCKREDSRIEMVKPSEDDISITEEQLKKKLGADCKCDGIFTCISLMASYLKEFELQNLVSSLRNYRPFSLERNCMHIDGLTIKNLELLQNSVDGTTHGSLLWVVDHTCTVFGKRLLKRWVTQPLISVKAINKRLDAVSELAHHLESTAIKELKKGLNGCLDIEKNLTSIFYRKISPQKFIQTMEALSKLNNLLIQHAVEMKENFTSSVLKSIFDRVPKLLGTDVDDVLGSLDKEAASKHKKETLFRNLKDYPRISKAQEKIQELEEELEEHRVRDLKKFLGGPVEYKTVSGCEYLVEIKNKELSKIPQSWVKVNSTKQVTRFRPLFVEGHYKKLCQTREKLQIAANAAWESFLNDFSDMYDFCRKAVLKFAELDCLMSLAIVARKNDYYKPVFDADCNSIEIIDGRHPVLSALLTDNQQYVPNDTKLGGDRKAMIVSGPNMGGKSSYIRQVAVTCILAQIGSYIPASSARLCAIDGVYTRMGSSDDIAKGKSTFMLELEQASMIIREATPKSLVILDELGRGTSTYDGMAIASATLKFFIETTPAFTFFVTHYPMLSEFEQLYPGKITNNHMAFMSASDDDSMDSDVPAVASIIFLYKLIAGAATKSYGLNVARLAGMPSEIIIKAAGKSSKMEAEVQQRVDGIEKLKEVFSSKSSIETLKEIIGCA